MKKSKSKKQMISKSGKYVISFIIIIFAITTFLTWFGGSSLFLEYKGYKILENPVAILAILMILWGTWYKFRIAINKKLIVTGFLLLLGVELWYFFTWHLVGYYEEFSLFASVDFANPEFYIGFLVTIGGLIASLIYTKE